MDRHILSAIHSVREGDTEEEQACNVHLLSTFHNKQKHPSTWKMVRSPQTGNWEAEAIFPALLAQSLDLMGISSPCTGSVNTNITEAWGNFIVCQIY